MCRQPTHSVTTMTQLHTSAPAPRVDAPERRRGFTVWLSLLRVLAVLHALAAIGQPLWIGQYLNGLYTWLGIHSAGAGFCVAGRTELCRAAGSFRRCDGRSDAAEHCNARSTRDPQIGSQKEPGTSAQTLGPQAG